MERLTRSREMMGDEGEALADVVRELLEESTSVGLKHVTESSREYRIRLPITPESLESISSLPFEVFLSEHHAGTTLITGTTGRTWSLEDTHTGPRTTEEARYTLHNHPSEIAASPSGNDLEFSRRSISDVDFIVAREGITVHKFSRNSGLHISDRGIMRPYIRWLRGGDHAVRNDITRGYAQAWIPWGDPRVQDICDYLNGKSKWGDIKESVQGST